MRQLTDESLAFATQRGDSQALAELIARHHGPLIGYLYRMCGGDRALAEDLTQEALLRVLRGIDRYAYPRPFKPWLYRIATNLARDHFKRADTRLTESLGEDNNDRSTTAPSIEGQLIAAADRDAVIAAVMALPETHRAVIVMRYYQAMPHAEIATALGIPIGTVKSRLHNAHKRLRCVLEDEHNEDIPHHAYNHTPHI